MRQATFDDNEKTFLQVTETSFSQAVSLLQISTKSIIFYKKTALSEPCDGGDCRRGREQQYGHARAVPMVHHLHARQVKTLSHK